MDWQGFYIASAGASAALTGLIFVGISININKILSSVMLIDRAFISILLLLTALVISLIRLIPGQDGYVLGTEVLITVLISWSIITRKDIGIFKLRE